MAPAHGAFLRPQRRKRGGPALRRAVSMSEGEAKRDSVSFWLVQRWVRILSSGASGWFFSNHCRIVFTFFGECLEL